MTDKLITIQYASVGTSVTVEPVVAKSELYDANIKVNVSGAEESSVPTSGRYQRALSKFLATESSRKTVGIPLLSNTLVADSFGTITQFRRVPVELVTTADQKRLVATKNTFTLFNQQDVIAKSAAIVKGSLVVNSSSVNKLATTQKSDLVNFSDIRVLRNLKVLLAQFVATELLNRTVNYHRTFTDLVDITDDYYGLSNVDDDQYAYFDKRLVSVLLIREPTLPIFTVNKPVSDSAKLLQIRRSLARISKLEQANLQDFSTRRPRKNNVETVTETDVIFKNYAKPLKELKSVSDSKPLKTLQNQKSETTTSSLVVYKNNLKQLIEQLLASETVLPALFMPRQYFDNSLISVVDSKILSLVKTTAAVTSLTQFVNSNIFKTENSVVQDVSNTKTAFIRDFHNYLYATDDYFGLANVDDDQIALFDKRLLNLVNFTELHSRDIQSVKSSSANMFSAPLTKNLSTVKPDIYLVTELTTKASDKKLTSNNLTISDIVDILRGTFFFDNFTLQDTFKTFILQKFLQTTAAGIDSASTSTNKPLFSSATLIDPKSFQLLTSKTDFAVSSTVVSANTQPVYRSSTNSALDLATFASNLGLVNSTSFVQDLIDILSFISYSVSSPVSAADIGYANNQNYFSEAYVEPGYVGTNSYFS
jgi:hypothetical protein